MLEGNKYIFLLGGADLEMQEIRRILKRRKLSFVDRNLTWENASWEAYQDLYELPENNNQTFVGIELQDKELKPHNAIDIDHHNDSASNKSSLEQVLDLLGIQGSFSRRRQLIAANDIGYIQAMKELGAKEEEIEKIRRQDRKAQGVTEEDERLAVKAIEENSMKYDDLSVVRAFNEKFSPITDRLFGRSEQHIIYTDHELVYYGPNRDAVASFLEDEIKDERAYRGGDENGFVGLKSGLWSKDEILSYKDAIIAELTNREIEKEEIYSHHIFLFPFKWEKREDKKRKGEDPFDLKSFEDLKKKDRWKSNLFNLQGLDRFNEYNYFYNHVREMIYETDESLSQGDHKNQFMRHYEYQLKEGARYNIRTENTVYSLEIDTIILNVYKMGTAVLSFHLRNHEYSDPSHILEINKFGRRISVPFFGLKPESIYSGKPDESYVDKKFDQLKATRFEIPKSIWIGDLEMDNDANKMREDFTRYMERDNFQRSPFILPGFIKHLFPEGFIKDQNTKEGNVQLSLVLDDRMHVISWFGHTEQANELSQVKLGLGETLKTNEPFYSYESSSWWQKYVFVDTDVMQTDRFVRQRQLASKTYSRFVKSGTLYGISRYSFVMITESFSELGGASYLVRHLQSMYYKIVELCLLQRATILRFSDEIARLSQAVCALTSEEIEDRKSEELSEKITDLYRRYIFFINRIYFREITPQEQGIELYDMLQENMRLPQEVKNLDEELRELNAFVEMVNNRRNAKEQAKIASEAHRLTRNATLLLLPTLIAGIYGMNTLPPTWEFTGPIYWPFWISIGLVIVSMIVVLLIWRVRNIKQRKK